MRFEGGRFDDDLNLRKLAPIFVADFFLKYPLTQKVNLTFSLVNAFNETIETAVDGTGLITLGQPRAFFFGVGLNF